MIYLFIYMIGVLLRTIYGVYGGEQHYGGGDRAVTYSVYQHFAAINIKSIETPL